MAPPPKAYFTVMATSRGIETDKLSETIFEKVIQTFILQIFYINIYKIINLF